MKVFLCAFQGFSLAIPMQSAAALMLYTRGASRAVLYNRVNENTYFSLPHLFGLPRETVRHGIILKNSGGDDGENLSENRNILLTTRVERDEDIPDDTIYPLPGILKNKRFSWMFSGIQFSSAAGGPGGLVLVLNCESLVKRFI
jgi:hypothetical protein